jgi:hypothetical protein
MVRYSFLVGLFHPRLHAGLSRRLRSLTVTARLPIGFVAYPLASRARFCADGRTRVSRPPGNDFSLERLSAAPEALELRRDSCFEPLEASERPFFISDFSLIPPN